jgi:hypothetical protein
MKIKNINNLSPQSLTEGIASYLNTLEDKNKKFHYHPCKEGVTEAGKEVSLGFSCYGLKTLYTIDKWDKLSNEVKNEWAEYINSFQKNISKFSVNSYVDNQYIDHFEKFNIKNISKDGAKSVLNIIKSNKYRTRKEELIDSVRAETKQAIATLKQVGFRNKFIYDDFPKTSKEVYLILDSYDWSKPWSAGAQFSSFCVFAKAQGQENKEYGRNLIEYIDNKVNVEDGCYYKGDKPNFTQLINGSMKVITGLDWLGVPIHYPEKLIDVCLSRKPSQSGCDLVDYVYVLYRSSLETNYKRKEIVEYLYQILELIFSHYYEEEGGFSYNIGSSQKLYYGVEISKGNDQPDIHGTILLTWALAMIFVIIENDEFNWNILKP